MSLYRSIHSRLYTIQNERRQIREQATYPIHFYNCWEQKNEDMYWRQFLEHRHLLDTGKEIAFFSVFGRRKFIDKIKADVKIFYSAENLRAERFSQYSDCCLSNPEIELSMGFDYIEDSRYLRFPLWMDYMFDPWMTEDDIKEKCASLRHPLQNKEKTKFCCMVASNPGDGLRKEMFDGISTVKPVDSAGRFLHNDDSLLNNFGNVKTDYLSQYAFNICPENTDAPGYVTEKLFECISCGCIPIYWGSDLCPEPDIVNKDAIILWDRANCGAKAISQITELVESPKLMSEFLEQPRLLPGAEEYVINTFRSVETRLREILAK